MIISDLQYLENVSEDNRILGGLQLESGSSSSGSGLATTGRVSTSEYTYSSARQQPYTIYSYPFGTVVVGTLYETTASASASGYTSPS